MPKDLPFSRFFPDWDGLSEEEQQELTKRHEAREKMLSALGNKFTIAAKDVRKDIERTSRQIAELQAGLDNHHAHASQIMSTFLKEWDAVATPTKLPVKGGVTVPWTKVVTPNELILAAGDGEAYVITIDPEGKALVCWFTAEGEDGMRDCYICRRRVRLPLEGEPSIIPDEIPAHIREAMKP